MSSSFAIDKTKVRQSFSSAAYSYDELASLQRKIGFELLERSAIKGFTKDVIVDIGCGTGFLTQQLVLNSTAQQIIAVDIAMPMLQVSRHKLRTTDRVQYICADAEHLPLKNHTVNKIVSNLALQWCQNLTDVFAGFQQTLQPAGQFFFSTFGSTTLQELKQAWSEVDDYTHVNKFYSVHELLSLLQQAGFVDIQIETKLYQSYYQTVMELMKELKGIGSHNVSFNRNKQMTNKLDLQLMIEAYEKYRLNGLIPATYEIIFVVAKI